MSGTRTGAVTPEPLRDASVRSGALGSGDLRGGRLPARAPTRLTDGEDATTAARTASSSAQRGRHGGGRQRAVRPGADRDLVLPRPVDDDQRHPGGHAAQHGHGGGVDTVGAQLGERAGAGVVIADRPDERDRPAARGGHGGVGALAATEALHPVADDGLPGTGQPRGGHDQVDVDGTHDDDSGHGET